jgi:hypothetical protein
LRRSREKAAKEAAVAAQQARIRELKAEQAALTGQVRSESFQLLLQQADPEFVIDRDAPHTVHGTFEKTAQEVADEYSTEQFNLFVSETPNYFACQENADILTQYLSLNGNIHIVSAKTFNRAYERLLEAGLLVTGAPVEKKPLYEPWTWVQDLNFDTAKDTDIVAGANRETGEPASYTYAQVKQFSTEQYRKFISKDFRDKSVEQQEYREMGIDPETREQRWYSAREIDKMTPEAIRKTFVLGRKLANVMQQPDLQ